MVIKMSKYSFYIATRRLNASNQAAFAPIYQRKRRGEAVSVFLHM